MHMNELIDICCERGKFDRKELLFEDSEEGRKYEEILLKAIVKIGYSITYNGIAYGHIELFGDPFLVADKVATADLVKVPEGIDVP